jgi:outer membrane protein assembly factor BamB
MDRRRFCALAGSSLLAGTAGCLGPFGNEPGEGSEPSGDATPTATPAGDRTPAEEPMPDPVPDYDAAWSGYQSDAAHTGTTAASGPGERPVVTWQTDTWGAVTSPAVGEGRAFFGTGLYHERVGAVDLDTGETAWTVGVDDELQATLGVADGFVYAAAGSLYAFTADDGQEVWTAMEHGEPEGVTVTDGVAYTASRDRRQVAAFDAHDGEELWTADVTGITTPAVRDDRLFVSSHSGVHALDATSGDISWEIEPEETVRAPLTVGEDLVYATTRNAVTALAADSGDAVWSHDGRFRRVSPALADGTLYVSGYTNGDWADEPAARVLALDAATGDVEWTFEHEGLVPGSPVVADGVVYVPSRRNWLYALDAATGDRRWAQPFGWSVSTPAVADGRVYANAGGRLTAIAGPDAEPAHDSLPDLEPAPYPAAPDYSATEFYFGSAGYDVTATAEATVDEDAPFDVSLDAAGEVIDADSEVGFEFALHNRSDEKLGLTTGAPRPLGVVTLGGVDGTTGRITAWTEAYEESGHVHDTPHRGVTGVNAIGLSATIEPDERIEETYTLSAATHAIQPGSYEYSSTHHVSTDGPGFDDDDDDSRDQETSDWQFELTIEVEIEQPAPEAGETLFDLAVMDAVTPPEAFVGEFEITALEPVTDRHPGLIEIALTNQSDERELIASQGGWPFGSYVGEAPDGSRVVLLREDMFAPAYVRGDGPEATPAFLPHMERRRGGSVRGVDAGETLSARYLVFAHPDDAPLESGTYTFKHGYADRDVEFTSGFLLGVL